MAHRSREWSARSPALGFRPPACGIPQNSGDPLTRAPHRSWARPWVGFVVATGVVALLLWVFPGSASAVWRTLVASAAWKVALALIALTLTGAIVLRRHRRKARVGRLLVAGVCLACAALSVMTALGQRARAVSLMASTETTEAAQPAYQWRQPWTVAAQAVPARAGSVVADFDTAATTYLPATGQFVTPGEGRGWFRGTSYVMVQSANSETGTVCQFAADVPKTGGWWAKNLRRAVAEVSWGLSFDPSDSWVYCDDGQARLVLPVTRWVGSLEQHQVPAGVLIWDGSTVEHRLAVKSGELPGPVYPMSLATAQRRSLDQSQGLWAGVTRRAGFETSEDVDGDPNVGNPENLLLKRADGAGWDFVTPLTPRGKSFSVIAVATISADHVTDGQLNTYTVHRLVAAREGNSAVGDRVKAAFPDLGWAASLHLVEVVPTSATTWEATLANGRAVANRIRITQAGSMCLVSASGQVRRCVGQDGTVQNPTDANDADTSAGSSTTPGRNLRSLSDRQLAELAAAVAAEQLSRLGT